MSTYSTLWPLDASAPSLFVINGKSVSQHKQERIPSELTIEENAWISTADLEAIATKDNVTLVSLEGDKLASKGNGDEQLSALSSFVIRYPWNLINVAEQLIKELSEDEILGEVHPNAVVEGTLHLGKGSRILPGVYIEGNVTVGENCKIGPNCYIRGNTSIGNNCHIGQSVEIKNSIIGNNTNVGHLSYIGDTIIGNNANMGAGTITSNFRHDGSNHRSVVHDEVIDTGRRKFGAIFGDGVHTGINTSVYPGRKIRKNCSTLPAEVVQKDIHS